MLLVWKFAIHFKTEPLVWIVRSENMNNFHFSLLIIELKYVHLTVVVVIRQAHHIIPSPPPLLPQCNVFIQQLAVLCQSPISNPPLLLRSFSNTLPADSLHMERTCKHKMDALMGGRNVYCWAREKKTVESEKMIEPLVSIFLPCN